MRYLKDDNEVKALNYYVKVSYVVAEHENKQALFFAGEKIWNEYNEQIKDTLFSYILNYEENLLQYFAAYCLGGNAKEVVEQRAPYYTRKGLDWLSKKAYDEFQLTVKCLQIIMDSDDKIGGFIKASNLFCMNNNK